MIDTATLQGLLTGGEKELGAVEDGMRNVLINMLKAGGAPFENQRCNESYHANVIRVMRIYCELMEAHPAMAACIKRGDPRVNFGGDK